MFRWLLLVTFSWGFTNAIVYDCYHGTPATRTQVTKFSEEGITEKCSIDILPCDENEERRLDGSCNNLKYPASGGYHTPQDTMIPAEFSANYEPRRMKSGESMMLARALRNKLLKIADRRSNVFCHAMGLFAEYMINDVQSIHDITNYVSETTDCCTEEGKTNYMCTPNMIPEDDPVHRFSGYRCMNQTRPMTLQNQGCTSMDSTPKRINYATVSLDLSNIYYYDSNITGTIRKYDGGLLKSEIVNGSEFASDGNSSCMIKDAIETGCTRNVPKGVIGSNLFTTWQWRLHNNFARNLAIVNPTWNDDKLFYTARDMNIAFFLQVLFYEFWVPLLGRENMLKYGVISEESGFRDLYDPDIKPSTFEEFAFGTRWFHTAQAAVLKLFDENYDYIGNTEVTSFAHQIEALTVNDLMAKMARGIILEAGADIDDVTDPIMSEASFTPLQAISDVHTQDMNMGRHLGYASYIQYRDLRMNYTISHESFDNLTYIIDEEKLAILRDIYESVQNIELLPGLYMENHIEGGYVPDTLGYIILNQLRRSIITDRFWYERENRTNAFTSEQLQEIRKASLAGMLCNVENGITRIQPQAFFQISEENPLTDCSEIPFIDFTAWKEECNE